MKLFASDIDNTLIPQKEPLNIEEIKKLEELLRGFTVVYLSGRNFSLVTEILPLLPSADFIAPEVGTSIYKGEKKDKEYEEYLLSTGYHWKALEGKLRGIEGLSLQEESAQTNLKLSYYLERESSLSEVEKALKDTPTKIVYSKDIVKNIGLLDIIPNKGGKAGAMKFISRKLGIDKKDVFYAGDSGNDFDALNSGFKGIVVGNASTELKNAFKNDPDVYIAGGRFSKGVIEGIEKYHEREL